MTIAVAVGRFACVIGRGLLESLEDDPDLRVVGAGLDRRELELAVSRGEVRVAILDEDGRGRAGGCPGAARRASRRGARRTRAPAYPRVYATQMIAPGVNVCLSTDASAPEIAGTVRRAADGEHVFVAMSTLPLETAGAAGAPP